MMASDRIQRLQGKVAMGSVSLGNCIVVLYCSVYLCCIWAEAVPSIGSFLEPGSAPEPSSFTDSEAAPHPSAVPSVAPSESSEQLGSVSSPTPVSVALSPKDFPLLPAPIDMWGNSSAPLWWNSPGDQSSASNSPPPPITPIADPNSVPRLPLKDSPTSAQKKDPPYIIMKDCSLGGGAKAGISLAVVAVIFLALIGTYVYLTRKQNMKKANTFHGYV